MDHECYMRQALELARQAMAEGEVPVGCVIVRDGVVVGQGRNRRETGYTALGHAEIEAIHQACQTLGGWRLAGCSLYVTLEPCPMCAGALVQARPDLVVFGAFDPAQGGFGSRYALHLDPALGGGVQALGGVLRQECEAALTAFFRARRAGADGRRGDG